ncbi:hypothetical protein SMSP2_01857 [Limihaloglobus sulfuriphilus]|uniref:LamG-like jellyroll fold domain-containing protein n=1 Tax=Limihaloglobus sulfuriphilus TaxID=1851148 RepID=A0A1Q2MFK4_9BACT|nr:LamG domain-containing protein [Limihaloglobus sulfuriphilus]AQQ71483.1 hypothetical protein SMSP2_01857 [Limihaloglobus sulfuriphilus]
MKKLTFTIILSLIFTAAALEAGQLLWHLPFDVDTAEAVSGELAREVKTNDNAVSPYNKQAPGIGPVGVNGKGRCLDMSVSMAQMGSGDGSNYGGWVTYGANDVGGGNVDDVFNGLQSFTLMGWINTGDPNITPAENARILLRDDNANGLTVLLNEGGRLKVAVNGNWHAMPYAASYPFDCTDKWVFVAITYDGTASAGNLKFYRGFKDTASVTLEDTGDIPAGALASNDRQLVIGNNGGMNDTADKGFKGLIDELRLYGSYSDATGVLSSSEITNYKNQDVEKPWQDTPIADPLWHLPFDADMSDIISGETPSLVLTNPSAPAPYNEQPPVVTAEAGVRYKGGALDLRNTMAFMGAVSGENCYGGAVRYGTKDSGSGAVDDVLSDLKSFTLMGWLNTGDPLVSLSGMSSPARLCLREDYANTFAVTMNNGGRLGIAVNGQWKILPYSNTYPYTCTDEWVYFAITYDSTAADNNLKFYSARRNDGYPVMEYAANFNQGPISYSERQFVVGNNGSESTSADKGFKGLMDELRLFGSYDDGSGALPPTAIAQFKQDDWNVKCGDYGFMPPEGDINGDCIVDAADFAEMAAVWLMDNRPQ